MILPYSTDAPIYHFPWMTIVLIVVNCCTFALTGMGLYRDGWLLQYGNGLHPVEWLAYNFLHFGPFHLLGNMFFLWAFGIVVEGKLGWWKFLAIYLGIGIVSGFLIQVAMLGYRINLDSFTSVSSPPSVASWLEPSPVMAQEIDDTPLMDDDEEMLPGENRDGLGEDKLTPEQTRALQDELMAHFKPGAGGASLIIFALLGMVLVWAPKNEVMCFFLMGFRAGTFEVEYLYFCGLKIVSEIICMFLLLPGFEVTSEVGHVLGAGMGFGVGTLFLKLNWVDCENWDLFAYAQNKHGSMSEVGSWQDAAAMSLRRDRKLATPTFDDEDAPAKTKKKRAKAKLKAMESFDEEMSFEEPVEAVDVVEVIEEVEEAAPRKRSPSTSLLLKVRAAIKEGRLNDALAEVRRLRAADRHFELPKAELGALADAFFKTQNVRDSRGFLEEYIKRFPDEADRHRVKLAVLHVKFLKSPAAALKLLAAVDRKSLSADYERIYQQAARQAQKMVADGVSDGK